MRFFEQAHIKDALSYAKILINPLDELAWIRTLTLAPGIGTNYAGKIFDEFARDGSLERVLAAKFGDFLPDRARRGFKHFKRTLDPTA